MLKDVLKNALSESGISTESLATLTALDSSKIADILAGQPVATPDDIRRIARVFGLRSPDFLAGQADGTPSMLFFKSMNQDAVLPDIAATQVHDPIGRFLCAVRDLARLEDKLGHARQTLPRVHARPEDGEQQWMERAAHELRDELELEDKPIRSVVNVVESMGIAVFLVTEDELHPSIDGASTLSPRPAILINMVDAPTSRKPVHRWRMTLAHELAHLLLHGGRGPLVSPRRARGATQTQDAVGVQRWRFFDDFAELERQADALAACFLAPASGVRRVLKASDLDPMSWQAVAKIGGVFGLGRIAAINRIHDVFGLSDASRRLLEDHPALHYPTGTSEAVFEGRSGFAPPALRVAVRDAVQRNLISKIQAWEILGLPLGEAAPKGWLRQADSRPPVSQIQTAMSVVIRWLRDQKLESYHPAHGMKAFGGIRVAVEESVPGGSGSRPAGFVLVRDGVVCDDRINTNRSAL